MNKWALLIILLLSSYSIGEPSIIPIHRLAITPHITLRQRGSEHSFPLQLYSAVTIGRHHLIYKGPTDMTNHAIRSHSLGWSLFGDGMRRSYALSYYGEGNLQETERTVTAEALVAFQRPSAREVQFGMTHTQHFNTIIKFIHIDEDAHLLVYRQQAGDTRFKQTFYSRYVSPLSGYLHGFYATVEIRGNVYFREDDINFDPELHRYLLHRNIDLISYRAWRTRSIGAELRVALIPPCMHERSAPFNKLLSRRFRPIVSPMAEGGFTGRKEQQGLRNLVYDMQTMTFDTGSYSFEPRRYLSGSLNIGVDMYYRGLFAAISGETQTHYRRFFTPDISHYSRTFKGYMTVGTRGSIRGAHIEAGYCHERKNMFTEFSSSQYHLTITITIPL